MKEKNQNTIVVAVGCYAQVAKEELKKIPEIDLISVISFLQIYILEFHNIKASISTGHNRCPA